MSECINACEIDAFVVARSTVEASPEQDGRREDDDEEERRLGCDRAAQRAPAVIVTGVLMT
jgi:hypothetical protein